MQTKEMWSSKSNTNMTFTVEKMVFLGLVPELEKMSEEQYTEELEKGNFQEQGNVLYGNLKLGNLACGYVHYSEKYLEDKFIKLT